MFVSLSLVHDAILHSNLSNQHTRRNAQKESIHKSRCASPAAQKAPFRGSRCRCRETVQIGTEDIGQLGQRFCCSIASGSDDTCFACAHKDTRIFHFDDDAAEPASNTASRAWRGLDNVWCGQEVFVLDTFLRYNQPTADVAIIEQSSPDKHGQRWRLGQVRTCKLSELKDVQYKYDIHLKSGRQVVLRLRKEKEESDGGLHVPDLCKVILAAYHAVSRPVQLLSLLPSAAADPVVVRPAALDIHLRSAAEFGETHHVEHMKRNENIQWLLDLPLPVPFTMQPWRCRACTNVGTFASRVPLAQLNPMKLGRSIFLSPILMWLARSLEHWFPEAKRPSPCFSPPDSSWRWPKSFMSASTQEKPGAT